MLEVRRSSSLVKLETQVALLNSVQNRYVCGFSSPDVTLFRKTISFILKWVIDVSKRSIFEKIIEP
jgi:hypothetical protein